MQHDFKQSGVIYLRFSGRVKLIAKNKKMATEMQKTSMYWSNADEFFAAYISGNYKQIIKDKKKQNK